MPHGPQLCTDGVVQVNSGGVSEPDGPDVDGATESVILSRFATDHIIDGGSNTACDPVTEIQQYGVIRSCGSQSACPAQQSALNVIAPPA